MRFATALLALTSAGCSQIAMASTITEFNRASFHGPFVRDAFGPEL
jgi:hypothetical protein